MAALAARAPNLDKAPSKSTSVAQAALSGDKTLRQGAAAAIAGQNSKGVKAKDSILALIDVVSGHRQVGPDASSFAPEGLFGAVATAHCARASQN